MACIYLHQRQGTYYFRMALPSHLHYYCGQREWVYSLDTKSYAEARRRCLAFANLAHELLTTMDYLAYAEPTLSPERIREIVRDYFADSLARLRKHMDNARAPHLQGFLKVYLNKSDVGDDLLQLANTPAFYTADSMKGVLKRNKDGQITTTAFKIMDIPIINRPTIADIMEYILQRHNIELKPQYQAYKALQTNVKRSIKVLEDIHQQYVDSDVEPYTHDILFQDLLKNSPSVTLVKEVMDAYTADVAKSLENSTIERMKIGFKWFIEKFGNLPIHTINKKTHANQFKELLTKIPAHASKKYKGLSLTDLEKTLGDKLSYSSQKSYLTGMRCLFSWAKNAGFYEPENPFSKVEPPKPAKGKKNKEIQPFSPEMLQQIFSSSIFTGHAGQRTRKGKKLIKDSLYWLPLLALFTGARREELCQLSSKDIYQKDNIWVIDIHRNGNNHLKNEYSERFVPIHENLINLGFVDYALDIFQKEKMLFPDLTFSVGKQRYGDCFGRQFSRAMSQLDIKTEDVNFHSFRHTCIDALRNARAEEGVIMALVGHKDNRMIGHYGKGYSLAVLKSNLDKVEYPSISWEKVGVVEA
ncbi:MAG: site-specific integrase [Alphaproteobacteria bacterium]